MICTSWLNTYFCPFLPIDSGAPMPNPVVLYQNGIG
jgi:hypothetical protein